MTDYNKLPTAIVISFTYKYFGHLDVEIIVKLHTSKFVQFMRVAQCRQRNSASAEDRLEEIPAHNLGDTESKMPVGQLNNPVLSKVSISFSE
jgi:hypothetical protein